MISDDNLIDIKKDCRGDEGIYMIDILKQMGYKAGLDDNEVDVSVYEHLIDAIDLPDVDIAKLRQCKKEESIMYRLGRKGYDESKMTLSYCDIIRLRLLYEWQSTGNKSK